jgi:O-antigen/teichoic acid export membrane protein
MVWISTGREIKILKLSEYKLELFLSTLENGFKIASQGIFSMIGNRAIDAIVGLHLGAAVLGQFKIIMRVYELLAQLTINPVGLVAFASLPKLAHDKEALRRISYQMTEICMIFFVPMLAGLGLTAAEWVPLVLGDQWMGTIPSIQILAFISVANVYIQFQMPVFLALQRNTFVLKQSAVRLVMSTGFCWVAAQFSIEAVIAAFVAQFYIFMCYNKVVLQRTIGGSVQEDVRMVSPIVLATFVMAAAVVTAQHFIKTPWLALDLAIMIVIGAASYGGFYVCFFRANAIKIWQGALNTLKKTPAAPETLDQASVEI